ncbi:hypothetical protein I3760_13G096700 [Carya illinoinensis]|nr:hypothetical protein I3760_13G096700 [Carya illinoinensis]
MQFARGGVRFSRTFPSARWLCAPRHSSTNLFVGGLSYDTNEAVLKDAFGQHGEIIEAKVICDHVSGRSKGYGFVRFTSETAATTALNEMDGQMAEIFECTMHTGDKSINFRYYLVIFFNLFSSLLLHLKLVQESYETI